MPPKNYAKKNELAKYTKNKQCISGMELKIIEQTSQIRKLEERIRRKEGSLKSQKEKLASLNQSNSAVIAVSSSVRKRRMNTPTPENLSVSSKRRRVKETLSVCNAIHGSSEESIEPAMTGMLQTLSSKCKGEWLADKILSTKTSLTRALKKKCNTQSKTEYYSSIENLLRSMNVYYSQDVLGKRKYMAIRKSNKTPGVVNFVDYKTLARHIRTVDIGDVQDIEPVFTHGLPDEEIGDGMFRNLVKFAPFLAEFYLHVNETRFDKLKEFTNFPKKNENSFLFLIAIGDEAPGSGMTFLISFINAGKRVASSFDNHTIFGGNVKENGTVVRRYVLQLLSDLRYLESEVFNVTVYGTERSVEFRVQSLPNDLKMLAFLAGELTNAATYFTTFANVNINDSNDTTKSFSPDGICYWKPFNFQKRIQDAVKVQKKKVELSKKIIKSSRSQLTNYIANELHSRQEEAPLVGKYIDLAKCEPLHTKNNTVKGIFMKVLMLIVFAADIPSTILVFRDLSLDNLFVEFVSFVKTDMN